MHDREIRMRGRKRCRLQFPAIANRPDRPAGKVLARLSHCPNFKFV
jgi:hypothetical protein